MESLLIEEDALLSQTGITAERAITFDPTVVSRVQVFQHFLEAVFLVLPMESLLVEVDVMSRQTGIKAEKGHNF